MSAKRKKKPRTAQHLIDSLLDERTPPPKTKSEISGVVRLREDDSESEFAPPRSHVGTVSSTDSEPVLINAEEHELQSDLELEGSEPQKKETPSKRPRLTSVSKAASIAMDEAEETATAVPLGTPEGLQFEPEEAQEPQDYEQERTIRLETKATNKGFSVVSSSQVTAFETQLKDSSSFGHDEQAEPSHVDQGGITELKTSMKQRHEFGAPTGRTGTAVGGVASVYTSTEAALRQSESLRIAQSRITELEAEIERLRRDNEKLATAGETLSRRADELIAKIENLEIQKREADRIHEEEKKVFRGQVQQKDREIVELRGQLEEMEARLENNFKKIRVRERELEHRLEIVRMESQTLISTKDKMILDLKRQIDQLTHENEYGKQKTQELYNQYKDKQETVRRVVRALRIALTILEGDDDSGSKKSE